MTTSKHDRGASASEGSPELIAAREALIQAVLDHAETAADAIRELEIVVADLDTTYADRAIRRGLLSADAYEIGVALEEAESRGYSAGNVAELFRDAKPTLRDGDE